ncbi:MAG: mandelate racemase/muconate lactonizing enzyme family protein [Motilibacteraceae bacterium]
MSQARLDVHRVEVTQRTTWWIVRIVTEDGLSALGECSDAGPAAAVLQETRAVADHLRGRDLLVERERIVAELAARVRLAHGNRAHTAATVLGGVEQALVDLAARDSGVPLWKWLGGEPPSPIRLYANINRIPGGRRPEDFAAAAAAAVESGFTRVKCAPFDVREAGTPLARLGVERLRAVRVAVGEQVELFADFHEHLSWTESLEALRLAERLELAWVEDVVPIHDVDRLLQLRSHTQARLAGGEMVFDPTEAAQAVAAGAIDVIMPDVKHAGGISRALDIAGAFPAVEISPHNPSGPVASLAAAHAMCAVRNARLLEFAFGEVPWRADLVGGAEHVDRGWLHLSDEPGIGAELDTTHPSVSRVWTAYL